MTKWQPATILDVRPSLSIADRSAILDIRNSRPIAFLAISDRYGIFFCYEIFDKMATGGYVGLDDNINYRTRPRFLDEQNRYSSSTLGPTRGHE